MSANRLVLILSTAMLVWLLAWAAVGQAQTACAPRAVVTGKLTADFGETRQSLGLGGGALVELWANIATGSWTITVTDARGLTCVRAAGDSFQKISDELEEGDDA